MVSVYGDDVLMVISCFENLPLAAVFPECVVSHAEPARAFSRQELINGMDSDEVILGLTWTENNAAKDGSVKKCWNPLQKTRIRSILAATARFRAIIPCVRMENTCRFIIPTGRISFLSIKTDLLT